MTKYSINHNNEIIEFTLVRKKVKNINLRVKSNGEIFVSCNNYVSVKYVKNFVISNSCKILKYLEIINKKISINAEKIYAQDEVMYYLGNKYKLNLIHSNKQSINIENDKINIFTKNPSDNNYTKKQLAKWYDDKADIVFNNSLNRVHSELSGYNILFPELKVRKMKKRWGSCYVNKNKIIINSKLIQTSQECIDFVLLHELAHFIYKYHDKNFYNFLTQLRPNWKTINSNLNNSITVDL